MCNMLNVLLTNPYECLTDTGTEGIMKGKYCDIDNNYKER